MREESVSPATIENNSKVTILLLNYNGWQDAIECLESVYKIMYPNWELILVDNGSVDGSVSKIKEWAAGKITVESKFFDYDAERKPIEYIEELFYDEEEAKVKASKKVKEWDTLLPHQKLSILRIEKNRGFTGGNNIGIEYILGEGKTDYILLLSNDTVVDREFLGELVKVAESDGKIGIVGPKILYYDHPTIINQLGGRMNYIVGSPIGYKSGQIDRGVYNKNIEVEFLSGTALLIDIKVFIDIGLLDPIYFVTHEDTDFEMRAQMAGYKLLCAPKSKLYHKISVTLRKAPGFIIYYAIRNRMIFMRRYASNIQIMMFFVGFYFFDLPRIIISSLLEKKISKKEILKYMFNGICDGLIAFVKEKKIK